MCTTVISEGICRVGNEDDSQCLVQVRAAGIHAAFPLRRDSSRKVRRCLQVHLSGEIGELILVTHVLEYKVLGFSYVSLLKRP